MSLKRIVSGLVLVSVSFLAGAPRPSVTHTGSFAISYVPLEMHQSETTPQYALLEFQAAPAPVGAQKLEEVVERQEPFALAGRNFTVVLHYKRLSEKTGPDSQALASLEIRDDKGEAQVRGD